MDIGEGGNIEDYVINNDGDSDEGIIDEGEVNKDRTKGDAGGKEGDSMGLRMMGISAMVVNVITCGVGLIQFLKMMGT